MTAETEIRDAPRTEALCLRCGGPIAPADPCDYCNNTRYNTLCRSCCFVVAMGDDLGQHLDACDVEGCQWCAFLREGAQ